MEKKRKNYLDYLDKTFLEELSYKIWVTKGARFTAHSRLVSLSRWSSICTSLLSAYLIIGGLVTVYSISNNENLNQSVLAYLITSISILLLVFTQVENSKHYELRAYKFHICALQLSRLYNELRSFKTLDKSSDKKIKLKITNELASKYEDILSNNENHADMDFEYFKSTKGDYYELQLLETIWIKIKYYLFTLFLYHFLILFPILLIVAIYIYKSTQP